MAIPDEAIALDAAEFPRDGRFALNLAYGERVNAVVIVSGVRYRRPAATNLAALGRPSLRRP